MPSEIIIIVIELMFLGVNMFLALSKTHFRAKMSLSRSKTNKAKIINKILNAVLYEISTGTLKSR